MKSHGFRILAPAALLPFAATVLALGIFIVDTLSDVDIAVPAFYTAVVLISVRFCKRRGVILVGLGCIGLTLLSDLVTASSGSTGTGFINTAISLLAIATTTFLAVKTDSARMSAYEARSQLAHIARVITVGELTASIAHEVNQPLAATVINGNACLRWLSERPPNLDEARQALDRIVKDANRASDVIARVRALTRGSPPEKDWLGINELVEETVSLMEGEIRQNQVSLQTRFGSNLPLVLADRVQVQQVILNLIRNAIEAMEIADDRSRELIIDTAKNDLDSVFVSIQDSGIGLAPENTDRMFDAFYSTKPNGMGMGLAISRSILEAHGGRIQAMSNSPSGAVFKVTLPAAPDIGS